MPTGRMRVPFALIVPPLLALLGGCRVMVDRDVSGTKADVDIQSPFGDVSVRTGVEAPDTGLPVYPGARPLRDHSRDSDNADVLIDSPHFGLQVIATKFEGDDTPERVIAFYKEAMHSYGDVTECRGRVDFKGVHGSRRPACKERPWSQETQLVTGTAADQRIVAVKPRGAGSEFAVLHLRTRG
jgi:hypothetical protein